MRDLLIPALIIGGLSPASLLPLFYALSKGWTWLAVLCGLWTASAVITLVAGMVSSRGGSPMRELPDPRD